MANRRGGLWAELQRERANRQRLELQARRASERAVAKSAREREQARRAAVRQASANEKERKQLYIEDRKAEATAMAADLQARVAELDLVLARVLRQEPGITFSSLKHKTEVSAFDPGGLDIRSLNRSGHSSLPGPLAR